MKAQRRLQLAEQMSEVMLKMAKPRWMVAYESLVQQGRQPEAMRLLLASTGSKVLADGKLIYRGPSSMSYGSMWKSLQAVSDMVDNGFRFRPKDMHRFASIARSSKSLPFAPADLKSTTDRMSTALLHAGESDVVSSLPRQDKLRAVYDEWRRGSEPHNENNIGQFNFPKGRFNPINHSDNTHSIIGSFSAGKTARDYMIGRGWRGGGMGSDSGLWVEPFPANKWKPTESGIPTGYQDVYMNRGAGSGFDRMGYTIGIRSNKVKMVPRRDSHPGHESLLHTHPELGTGVVETHFVPYNPAWIYNNQAPGLNFAYLKSRGFSDDHVQRWASRIRNTAPPGPVSFPVDQASSRFSKQHLDSADVWMKDMKSKFNIVDDPTYGHGWKKQAAKRLQLAEQMRKQAYFGEGVVDFLVPYKSMSRNFYNAAEDFGNGNAGAAAWSGAKGLMDTAQMIPGAGQIAKGVGMVGKGVGWAGKALQGGQKLNTFRGLGGGITRAGGWMAEKPGLGIANAAGAMDNRMPGGTFGMMGAQLGMTGAEMGHGALKNKLEHWSTPSVVSSPGQDGHYMSMARGHLMPTSNPMHAGFNPNFEM